MPLLRGPRLRHGYRQGAELTSLEQRWVATRTKDFCGPVDTISVGYHSPIINARGERVMSRYSHLGGDAAPRYIRANAPMEEWLNGRGPCYCDTTVLSPQAAREMMEDYLNERPSFVLFLASRGQDVTKEPIEIYGSDPYIVGGHTGSGYWVDINRMTTLPRSVRRRGNRRGQSQQVRGRLRGGRQACRQGRPCLYGSPCRPSS